MAIDLNRDPAAAPVDVQADIAALVQVQWGRLLAVLIGQLRDFQLAEDSLQDALESALAHWSRNGLPASPEGWLVQTARRKAIDRIRRARNFETKSRDYALLLDLDRQSREESEPEVIADERLRLIFTCCHPALEEKTRLALTLRTLGGLTTSEIARAFVDSETAMAQRLVRARHKIAKAGIPYEVPGEEDWPERFESVLGVVYLIFNEGYSATAGAHQVRVDLCDEAIRLARLLVALRPGEAESEGLLALMLLNHARAPARTGPDGALVALESQDRSLWNMTAISEGLILVEKALRRGHPGPYQLQAAISALHAQASDHASTGWAEIARIYDALFGMRPNPVFRVNGAVALSFADGPQAGLAMLEPLRPVLDFYQPFHAARADMLRRAGERDAACRAYDRAIALSSVEGKRQFLEERRSEAARIQS